MASANSGLQRVMSDVFETEQEAAAEALRPMVGEERRIGVAEMQMAVGAGREAKDGIGHSPVLA